jgi:hypothetical protein
VRVKTEFPGESADWRGVVVGHQEIALHRLCHSKQLFVVDFGMLVQPPASYGIGGIDKKSHLRTFCIFANELDAVTLCEANPMPVFKNRQNPPRQSLWIPPRSETPPVFPSLHQAGSGSHDAPALDSIPQNCLERSLKLVSRSPGQDGPYGFV